MVMTFSPRCVHVMVSEVGWLRSGQWKLQGLGDGTVEIGLSHGGGFVAPAPGCIHNMFLLLVMLAFLYISFL